MPSCLSLLLLSYWLRCGIPLLAHRWVVAGGVSQLTVADLVVWRAGAGWLLRVSLSWPVMLMQPSMAVTRDRRSLLCTLLCTPVGGRWGSRPAGRRGRGGLAGEREGRVKCDRSGCVGEVDEKSICQSSLRNV